MKKPGKMLGEVLSSAGKKPATVLYPFEKVVMPPQFRGRLDFISEKCSGCKLCVRDCPSRAITINKVGDKQFECIIDLDLCIYCAQCVDSCPKDSLAMTPDFELAQLDRGKLKLTFHAKPKPAAEKPAEKPAEDAAPKP
jgi:formate hydrogenlyase subunit 6/NADH:ubiquinone oxidoreductase subunit I